MASGNPNQIHGIWKPFHGHQHNILQNWKQTSQGLSQENIVYIEYFHIEIFIYFPIDESSQCAFGRKKIFKHFYIPLGFFFPFSFWKYYSPEEKWLANSRVFAFSNGKVFFFFFETSRAGFTIWNGAQDFCFSFASWEDFLVKAMYFVFPSTSPDPARSRMVSSKALWSGSVSLLWLSHRSHPRAPFVKTACMQSPRHRMHVQSVLPAPTALSPQLPTISTSRTTSWPAVDGKSEPPAAEINAEIECHSFESAKNAEDISLPLQRERERGKEWAKPESSGALPTPLEACDRSLFYPPAREIGSMCLIHSWTVSDSNSYLCRDAAHKSDLSHTHIHTGRHISIIYSTCTLDVLNTSCAVELLYYAVCSNKTSSYFIHAQGISILSIDIPDVETMNSPLCNNLVKALVLEGQRSREKYAVGLASPDSPPPNPFFQLSTAVWQPPPNPHPLPAHLSSPFIPTGQ